MKSRFAVAIFLTVIAGAHAILFADLPLILRTVAALTITGVAPALLLAAWLWPHDDGGSQTILESVVIVAALAWTTLTAGMLLLSYLPGGVTRWQVLVFYDVAMAALGLGLWWQYRDKETRRQGEGENEHPPQSRNPSIPQSPISNLQSPISPFPKR